MYWPQYYDATKKDWYKYYEIARAGDKLPTATLWRYKQPFTQRSQPSFVYTVKQQQENGLSEDEVRDVRLLKNHSQILHYSFNFLNKALVSHPLETKTFYNFQPISDVIRLALIDIEVDKIQSLTSNLISDLCMNLENNQLIEVKPSFFFINIFIKDCLDFALKQQNGLKTRLYFDLLNQVFMKTEVHKEISQIKPILTLIKDLTGIIYERDIFEVSARDEDVALQGVLTFLKNLFLKFPEIREQYGDRNKLLQFIIHDCLFHKETGGQLISKQKALPPKCKNTTTREKALDLLHELCLNNNEGLYILIRYMKKYISETFWRTPRRNDWSISVHQQERSLTGLVGLKNIGCICYMNSIMQQLFMIPTFRKSILEVEDMFLDKEPNDENVLYQLKMIFGSLIETEKQYYNPKKFCGAFKDIDGSSIDPMVQKDVDEFFNMLMDRIENLIKGKREDKVIKNLFQGVFANEFICKGCPHYSEREEPFLAINLQVKNKHSIKESLDAFVEGEMLEGDNAYYCEKCEKKVNTLKRCCIKRMPNVMFIVLKRFEFDYDTMTKFKINDYCEFPMSINMSDYGQVSLAKKDLLKEMEDKNLTLEDLNEEQKAILEKQIPSKYYEYNLKGAVIHMGTAEQGHYISIIQDRENPNGKWYEFNDH